MHQKFRSTRRLLGAAGFALKIGDIHATRQWLRHAEGLTLDEEELTVQADLTSLLERAAVLEVRYGQGALLKLQHPIVKMLTKRGRYSEATLASARHFAEVSGKDYRN